MEPQISQLLLMSCSKQSQQQYLQNTHTHTHKNKKAVFTALRWQDWWLRVGSRYAAHPSPGLPAFCAARGRRRLRPAAIFAAGGFPLRSAAAKAEAARSGLELGCQRRLTSKWMGKARGFGFAPPFPLAAPPPSFYEPRAQAAVGG